MASIENLYTHFYVPFVAAAAANRGVKPADVTAVRRRLFWVFNLPRLQPVLFVFICVQIFSNCLDAIRQLSITLFSQLDERIKSSV